MKSRCWWKPMTGPSALRRGWNWIHRSSHHIRSDWFVAHWGRNWGRGMFCECKIAACIGPHHRFRDVGKSSRKHGDSVRLSKLVKKTFAWCIHLACKIRDKAQRPSAFISQPCKRLTSSTPELRAQLNLTNDHKKKERPHLKHVLLPDFSWKKRWSQAQRHVVQPNDIRQGENRKMASCSLYLNELLIQKCKFRQKKRWSQAQRHAVQPNDSRQGENRKMASCFTILRRITNSKVSIQRSFQRVNF